MKTYFFVGIIFVLSAVLVSADFVINESRSFVAREQVGDSLVRGEILMRFDQQENVNFTSSFSGGSSLLEVLNSSNEVFRCDPLDCTSAFSPYPGDEGSLLRSIDFSTLYGFRIEGSDIVISDFRFNVTSDASASCTNQLSFDLLDDGVSDFRNLKHTGNSCSSAPRSWGCFDEDADLEEVIIPVFGESQYCEKVRLPPAAGYELGAKVSGSGERLELRLYDETGDPGSAKGCSQFPSDGEVHCPVTLTSLVSFDGFVCIATENADDTYRIATENEGDVCGGAGIEVADLSLSDDFALYARPLNYAPVESVSFDDEFYSEEENELVDLLNDYIQTRYGGDCSDECIIPLSFSGLDGQSVVLDEIFIEYERSGLIKQEREVYRVIERSPIISSEFVSLDLEAMGFRIPNVDGNQIFQLRFDDMLILEENVSVSAGFDFEISPLFALVGRETVFRILDDVNISSSRWDFGDGAVLQVEGGQAAHVFRNESNYEIEVSVTTRDGRRSTKLFQVISGNAERSANVTIHEYEKRLQAIENDLKELSVFVESKAREALELDELRSELTRAKARYDLSVHENDFVQVVTTLLEVDVPLGIAAVESGRLPMTLGLSEIDPGLIAEVSNADVSDSSNLRDGIILWLAQNYEPIIHFQTLAALEPNGERDLLRSYEIELRPLQSSGNGDVYLLIDHPFSRLDFESDAAELLSGGASVRIDGSNPEDINFVTIGSNPLDATLGMYISPVVSELDFFEGAIGIQKEGFNYSRFFLWLFVLLVVMFAAYIVLQTWYKRHYERHLFKNPNDLYNLINFVYNSRKNGMKPEAIRGSLKPKRWSGEQIKYASRKLDGKRTGMWEIPVFKFIENRKVRKELEKKNPGKPLDARFIKMPRLRKV